jgi:membrane glycosyltransferase
MAEQPVDELGIIRSARSAARVGTLKTAMTAGDVRPPVNVNLAALRTLTREADSAIESARHRELVDALEKATTHSLRRDIGLTVLGAVLGVVLGAVATILVGLVT